jgi:hypothetical protein
MAYPFAQGLEGGLMGNQDTPGGPPKVPPTPIRLKSSDFRDPPDQLANVLPTEDAPVTDVPDALSSDATMSQEVEVAVEPEVAEEEPVFVMLTKTWPEKATADEKMKAAKAAKKKALAISEDQELARIQRRESSSLHVVDEWTAGDEEYDLTTLEGQIEFIVTSLAPIVDIRDGQPNSLSATTRISAIQDAIPGMRARDLSPLFQPFMGTVASDASSLRETVALCIQQHAQAGGSPNTASEVPDLTTLRWQVELVVRSLFHIVDLSKAPFTTAGSHESLKQLVAARPPKLSAENLQDIISVLKGRRCENPTEVELLRFAVGEFVAKHRLATLREAVELRLMAKEVNEPEKRPEDQAFGAFLPEAEDIEEMPPPTAEDMAPYWDLVPELQCPEGDAVLREYPGAIDTVTEMFPAEHLDNEARTEAVADLALALTGVAIGFDAFERSVRILRGEQPNESTSLGARFPVVEDGARPAAVGSEWDTEIVAPSPLSRVPTSRRRSPPTMGSRGRTPISAKAETPPAVRRVKRERLVPVSALWSLAGLVVVLMLLVTAFLMRQDTVNRNDSIVRDTLQDEEIAKQGERLRSYGDTLAGAIADHAEQKSEIISLTRERDGYQSLADQSVEVVDSLRDEVDDLERDTRRRVSSVATDLSATQRDIRALQRQVQGSQGRERDLKQRLEATETMATSMVNAQKCPTVGSGTLTSGEAGTVFECRQAGAKAFVICIGADPATAHSCQMTTAPK